MGSGPWVLGSGSTLILHKNQSSAECFFYIRDKKPLTTFSVLNGNLVKTIIPQQATKRIALMPKGSHLKLGSHPMADSIRELGLSARPLMSFYCPERPAILPAGTIIEKGVRPMQGYLGKDRTADHTVEYPA